MPRASIATRIGALLALAVLLAPEGTAWALGPDVPTPLALKLMLRTLTFDQRFGEHGSGDFVVLVVAEPGQFTSRERVMAGTEELKGFKILNRPLRFVPAELKSFAGLKETVRQRNATAILVLPEVSNAGLEAVTRVAVENRLYTMSLDPALVQRTILLGVFSREGRPRIALNRSAIKEIGVNFESTLLQVAEIFPGVAAGASGGVRPR